MRRAPADETRRDEPFDSPQMPPLTAHNQLGARVRRRAFQRHGALVNAGVASANSVDRERGSIRLNDSRIWAENERRAFEAPRNSSARRRRRRRHAAQRDVGANFGDRVRWRLGDQRVDATGRYSRRAFVVVLPLKCRVCKRVRNRPTRSQLVDAPRICGDAAAASSRRSRTQTFATSTPPSFFASHV